MIETATRKAIGSRVSEMVSFVQGDSQALPFEDNSFDVVINECAVGIPDDSQKVLDEMLRVVKPGGAIAIHESTWLKELSGTAKEEISERYGTTPLEFDEWMEMLRSAGAKEIVSEFDQWSKPEMFWKIRKDREVRKYNQVMTLGEKVRTAAKIANEYGMKGVFKVFENEKYFFQTVMSGKLGYALFKGVK